MNSCERGAWAAGYLAGLREAERRHAWPTRQGREDRIRAELAEGQMIASGVAREMGRPADTGVGEVLSTGKPDSQPAAPARGLGAATVLDTPREQPVSIAAGTSTRIRVIPPATMPGLVASSYVRDGGCDRTLRHWRGGWYVWAGTHYTELDDDDLRTEVRRWLETAHAWIKRAIRSHGPRLSGAPRRSSRP